MAKVKEVIGKVKSYWQSRSKKRLAAVMATMMLTIGSFSVANAEGTTPTLDINFDVSEMFSWAQTIINAMLPVVYIIMGVALGFLIIRAFKSAFN